MRLLSVFQHGWFSQETEAEGGRGGTRWWLSPSVTAAGITGFDTDTLLFLLPATPHPHHHHLPPSAPWGTPICKVSTGWMHRCGCVDGRPGGFTVQTCSRRAAQLLRQPLWRHPTGAFFFVCFRHFFLLPLALIVYPGSRLSDALRGQCFVIFCHRCRHSRVYLNYT